MVQEDDLWCNTPLRCKARLVPFSAMRRLCRRRTRRVTGGDSGAFFANGPEAQIARAT